MLAAANAILPGASLNLKTYCLYEYWLLINMGLILVVFLSLLFAIILSLQCSGDKLVAHFTLTLFSYFVACFLLLVEISRLMVSSGYVFY